MGLSASILYFQRCQRKMKTARARALVSVRNIRDARRAGRKRAWAGGRRAHAHMMSSLRHMRRCMVGMGMSSA